MTECRLSGHCSVLSAFIDCRMVETVVAQLGRLDIAINNAGMNKNHAAEDCLEADWDDTFELNTKGVFLCCQVHLQLSAMLPVGRPCPANSYAYAQQQ